MRLELIGAVDIPPYAHYPNPGWEKCKDAEEQERELYSRADVARVTMADGSQHWTAEVNFCNGGCSCCGGVGGTITRVEAFKVVADTPGAVTPDASDAGRT